MSANDLLRAMSDRLELEFEPQDWGLVNADGDRFDEFVRFLRTEQLADTQRFELASLILASGNERLLDGSNLDEAELVSVIQSDPRAFDTHVSYWCRLAHEDEFPLSGSLRRVGVCRLGIANPPHLAG